VGNRIELRGKLARAPELRTTPAGTALLRIVVDCGAPENELIMNVVMTGERARAIAAELVVGREVRATGSLRATVARGGAIARGTVEVVADEISLARPD
jgi:primosomal replication protein N